MNLAYLAALIFSVIPATPATPADLTDPFWGMANPKRMLRGAELTDAQMAKYLEFRKATFEREQAIAKEKAGVWGQWETGLADKSADARALNAIYERASQLERDYDRIKVDVLMKLRAILTSEQLDHIAETQQRRRALELEQAALPPTVASERSK